MYVATDLSVIASMYVRDILLPTASPHSSLAPTQLPDDIHFSYLPLPHVFERVVQVGVIGNGGAIGFWQVCIYMCGKKRPASYCGSGRSVYIIINQGTPDKLVEDLQALRPTAMPAVPRVLNRIYDKIMQGVRSSSKLRQTLFNKVTLY